MRSVFQCKVSGLVYYMDFPPTYVKMAVIPYRDAYVITVKVLFPNGVPGYVREGRMLMVHSVEFMSYNDDGDIVIVANTCQASDAFYGDELDWDALVAYARAQNYVPHITAERPLPPCESEFE